MSKYRSDPEIGLDYYSSGGGVGGGGVGVYGGAYGGAYGVGRNKRTSACSRCLHYTWKTITCLFSHITLVSMVVAYCALGAFTFEALEVHHEREVKRNISKLRHNVTNYLWKLTTNLDVLEPENFTNGALLYLKEFENALLKAMTKDGWDGEEDINKVQWTSTGALFYSIIVITTIGYGHIAPKTTLGKVVTIFYAILGIPLMLLCLSNIGDIMATSFRFLYWRVCCYVCTKKPKKRRPRSIGRLSRNNRNQSFRRSMRISTRSADSGFGLSEISRANQQQNTAHSETDLRFYDYRNRDRFARGASLPRMRLNKNQQLINATNDRWHSLDRRKFQDTTETNQIILDKSPILCNRYVIGKNGFVNDDNTNTSKSKNFLELPRAASPAPSTEEHRKMRRKKSPNYNPSPKMMTPLGYGHRSKYLDDPGSDDEYNYYIYDDYYEMTRTRIKPVPIWLCVFLVISYIIAGAFLFNSWETWDLLDAAYFCFITLTTIGFGDLVPAKGVSQDGYRATVSIALCSLYLLFGIALLAMSFNLVQEEVIANVKNVAKTCGIIKNDNDDDESEYSD